MLDANNSFTMCMSNIHAACTSAQANQADITHDLIIHGARLLLHKMGVRCHVLLSTEMYSQNQQKATYTMQARYEQ